MWQQEHEVAIPLHHVAPVITYMLAMTKISSEKLSSEALAQLKTQKQLSPMPVTSLALRAGHLPGHETIELRFGHVGLAFQLRVEQLDALAGAITDRPGAAQPSGRKGPRFPSRHAESSTAPPPPARGHLARRRHSCPAVSHPGSKKPLGGGVKTEFGGRDQPFFRRPSLPASPPGCLTLREVSEPPERLNLCVAASMR
jgi:hypothetical protein